MYPTDYMCNGINNLECYETFKLNTFCLRCIPLVESSNIMFKLSAEAGYIRIGDQVRIGDKLENKRKET